MAGVNTIAFSINALFRREEYVIEDNIFHFVVPKEVFLLSIYMMGSPSTVDFYLLLCFW